MRKLAAGNWKMNGTKAALAEVGLLLESLAKGLASAETEVLLCPPATLLAPMAALAEGSSLRLGGQDCHFAPSGAHTGDISAAMLADCGASYVILGHSERRADHGESDALVARKAKAAHEAGLTAIICLGESESQRDAGEALAVTLGQLAASLPQSATSANTVVAYEPIWAIGSGRIPSIEQIGEIHDAIRAALVARFGADGAGFRLLYGGSVKPANAAEIFAIANVDGALVGGASLKAADFSAIIKAL